MIELVNLMSEALRSNSTESESTHQVAVALAGKLKPLVRSLDDSVAAQTPQNLDAAATASAQAVMDQLLGGAKFNTGRFVIAFVIWVLLLGGGIATEATHLTTASGALFGFAGALFGIVTAFLGSEKPSGQ